MNKDELKKLLYRKSMAENQMSILSKGAKTYTDYVVAIKAQLVYDTTELGRLRLEAELSEVELKARNFITSFKETQREYNHYIVPLFDSLSEEEKNTIEFKDTKAYVETLVDSELYKNTEKEPDNVEHTNILNDYKRNIKLTENLLKEVSNQIGHSTGYERAKLEKEHFDYSLKLINLNKRYAERVEYYNNTFMPMYLKDMEECSVMLDTYLKRAKEYIRLGIDVKLKFLLDEYEKHKDDEEKLWLFYTALRERCNSIEKYIKQGAKNLTKKILKKV